MGWPGRAQRLICWACGWRRYAKLKEHAMRTSQNTIETISTIGIDVGKDKPDVLDPAGGTDIFTWYPGA